MQQKRFVEEYCKDYNGTQAAIRAGYSKRSATEIASRLISQHNIKAALAKRMEELSMDAEEAVKRMSDWGRGTAHPFLVLDEATGEIRIDLTTEQAQQNLHLIKEIKQTDTIVKKPTRDDPDTVINRTWEIKLHDQKDAVDKILKVLGRYAPEKIEDVTKQPRQLVIMKPPKE